MKTPRPAHTAALALEYGDRLVLRTVRDVHRAVARRAFWATRGLGGRVPERIHDVLSTAVYDGLSAGVRGAGAAVRGMADAGIGAPIEQNPGGRQVVSALNGLVGSDLLERGDPHAITMAVRHDARDVALDPGALARAYPDARGHLVAFVHGLGENDDSWGRHADRLGGTYARRITAETTATPVRVRYNTGLHVSDNGAALAALLERLLDSWPVEVTAITLVGHSMGGLVVRAATNQASAEGAAWPDLVRHVVCLGTPHLGATLEKIVHVGGRMLRVFPESAPFGQILESRSPGIVDLRHGYISRQEWDGQDLSAQWGVDRSAAASLRHADYHFVAATVGPTRTHLLSETLGDWFVRYPSAAGRGRRGDPVVRHATVDHLAGTDHFALLNHPRIADWLVGWVNSGGNRGSGRLCALSEQSRVPRGSGPDRR